MNSKKTNKFLSRSIYQNIIPEDNFWRRVNELINWGKLSKQLSNLYKNEHGGNTNWSPETMLKILLLQRVYNASDRKTEELCTQNIYVKYFLGLEIQEKAPDYSSISKFRNSVLKKYGIQFYETLMEEILVSLSNKGLQFSGTYAVDSSITDADVNTWKDKKREEAGEDKRDKEASWTAKSRPKKSKDKTTSCHTKYYYGYKTHLIGDIENQMITAIIPKTASPHDNNFIQELVKKTTGKHNVKELTADAGYDDAFNINLFEKDMGIKTAIRIRKNRTNQQDIENENFWLAYKEDPERQNLLKKRGKIERFFADMKSNHGLRRCKYIGEEKFEMQSYLTAIVYNLKIGIKQVFGLGLALI